MTLLSYFVLLVDLLISLYADLGWANKDISLVVFKPYQLNKCILRHNYIV